MPATTIHAPGDLRVEEVPDPVIEKPTDAIVRVAAGCVCGSDLWPYRGENPIRAGAKHLPGLPVRGAVGLLEPRHDHQRSGRVRPVTQADGSLVATAGAPDDALVPSVLALTDVMPTG